MSNTKNASKTLSSAALNLVSLTAATLIGASALGETMTATLKPAPSPSPSATTAGDAAKDAKAKKAAKTAKKSTTDELTKKALKRAQIHELEREQQAEVTTTNEQVGPIIMRPVVQSGPAPGVQTSQAAPSAGAQSQAVQAGNASGVPSTPAVVESKQAPTEIPTESSTASTSAAAAAPTSTAATAASEVSSPAAVPSTTSPDKARQLIMTSHVHVPGESEESEKSDGTTDAKEGVASHEAANESKAVAEKESSAASTKSIETVPGTAAMTESKSSDEAHEAGAKDAKDESTSAPKAQASTVAQASSPTSAEQSLKWLTNGNIRYTKKKFRADGRSEKDRARIWNGGQKPHAIVLACSDSVVPPEVVFDQSLGEIFVVRTLGEVTDAAALASLEYAVQYLGPHMLVVMGHTKCDAVQGIIQVKESESAGSEALDHLLSEIRVHTKSYTSEKPSPNLEIESTLNADGVARDLVKRSEIIRKRVEAGQLVIKSALYRGDSGKVTFY